MSTALEVVEYTDPFCIWAWSTEPKLDRLRRELEGRAGWRTIIGILFDDAGESDAEAQLERWRAVVRHTGASLPARLEHAPRSSWPAAWVYKAATRQGEDVAAAVLRRLRESAFVDGRPADDADLITAALAPIPGLDLDALLAALDDDEVHAEADADWEETRNPLPDVLGLTEPEPHPGAAAPDGDRFRYRFPTLVLRGPGGVAVVPGWRDYEVYAAAAATVSAAAA